MLALIAFVELDLTLTAIAIGVSLGARRPSATVAATGLVTAVAMLGGALAWTVWMVAPACIADPNLVACTAGRAGGGQAALFVGEIGLLEWAWTVGVALVARSTLVRARVHG